MKKYIKKIYSTTGIGIDDIDRDIFNTMSRFSEIVREVGGGVIKLKNGGSTDLGTKHGLGKVIPKM